MSCQEFCKLQFAHAQMFQILSIGLSKCSFLKLEAELQKLVNKFKAVLNIQTKCNLNFHIMECTVGAGLNFMGNGKVDQNTEKKLFPKHF